MTLVGAGVILGFAVGHGAAGALGSVLAGANQWPLTEWAWSSAEAWIVAGALALGFLARLVPAMRNYRRDPAFLLLGR
jgi:hypothetical protein